MGISPLHAELIVREHKREALPKSVHLLGRQTVLLTLDDALALMRRAGVAPLQTKVEIDRQTHGAQTREQQLISDRTFFGLLGVEEVLAIDYTDYEGADIILDLTKPLPSSHVQSMDFLFGGSVLDNIFDPAMYLRNVSQLLRPGGRLFEHDIISQHHHPYCLVTPAWIYDYFVVNSYANCAVYVCEHAAAGFVHMYGLSPDADDFISDFGPPRGGLAMGIIVIAQKGVAPGSEDLPIQDQYRSAQDRARYNGRLLSMKQGENFFQFGPPSSLELDRLGRRTSKSYKYLGVSRPLHGDVVPSSGSSKGIRIFEATYGGNCSGLSLPKSGVNSIYRGNVSDIVGCLFNGNNRHEWLVDVNVLGDPAPQCGKDLEVFYTDLADPAQRLLRVYLPAEAAGRILSIP